MSAAGHTGEQFTGFRSALLVEGRVDVRSAAREALKELGVAQVLVAASVAEAWKILETMGAAAPDWIISDVEANESINAFHLLRLVLTQPKLLRTRVSFLVADDELNLIAPAFELGLLSFHRKPFTKMSLTAEIGRLIKGMSPNYSLHCLTAAGYLRDHLGAVADFDGLVRLEEALIARFPDDPSLFLKLAEAQVLAGRVGAARYTLWQARFLGADLKNGVKQLEDLVNADAGGDQGDASRAPTRPETALIVDPDGDCARQIETCLRTIGLTSFAWCEDGEAAARWLDTNPLPSLILQEWRLRKLSGAALFQRVMDRAQGETTVVVVSSCLQADDYALLREMGASAAFAKPIVGEDFLRRIMGALRGDRSPVDATSIERRLRLALKAGDAATVRALYARFCALADVPKAARLSVDAEMAYAQEDYAAARAQAQEALLSRGEAVVLLNLLGKILLKLGDNEAASQCLKRAHSLSSKNIERICMLAEMAAETGRAAEADEMLAAAATIDPSNARVDETEVKVALNLGDVERARTVMRSLSSLAGVLAYMNNRAVSLIRQGQITAAGTMYRDALEAVPPGVGEEGAALSYNMGLALIRQNDLVAAEPYLRAARAAGNGQLARKAQSLWTRLQTAVAGGRALKLQDAVAPEQPLDGSAGGDRPLALHAAAGEIVLHMIFSSGDRFKERAAGLLAHTPKFTWQGGDR